MTIGDIIRNYAEEHTMTQFIKDSGLSKAYVYMLINNKNNNGEPITPSLETIKKIAKGVHKDYIDLLSLIESNEDPRIFEREPLFEDIERILNSDKCNLECKDYGGGMNKQYIADVSQWRVHRSMRQGKPCYRAVRTIKVICAGGCAEKDPVQEFVNRLNAEYDGNKLVALPFNIPMEKEKVAQ